MNLPAGYTDRSGKANIIGISLLGLTAASLIYGILSARKQLKLLQAQEENIDKRLGRIEKVLGV
jgi:hypothetical protein